MGKRGWFALVFGLLLISALTMLRATDPYPVTVAREASFDLYQQIKPREAPADLPVRIIDIDEVSLAEVGQWPWPRSVLAELAARLTDMGAAVIAFDMLFSEPDRFSTLSNGHTDNDTRLAAALASGPSVLSLAQNARAQPPALAPKSGIASTGENATTFLPELGGATQPLPVLAEAASGLGVASLGRGEAGVARRLPLLWRQGEMVFPALAVEALRVASGVDTFVLLGDGTDDARLGQLRVGDFTIPTDASGDMWIYYRDLPSDIYIPAQSILAQNFRALEDRVAGHIVLVGTSASGLLDIRASTLGMAVPGVSIHAQALEQIFSNTFLDRAEWVGGLEILTFALAGVAIVLAVIVLGPFVGLLVSLAVAFGQVGISWLAFSGRGILIDPSYPLFGALVIYAAMAFFRFAVTDADRRRIRRAFAHYVEPSLLSRIEADGNLLKLGGDVRELTVMFSDVRNFSALAERSSPSQLVTILNRLFAALGAAIVKELGTIDKFMGDAVMAFWNAPVDVERHALHACRAALAMRAALDQLNAEDDDEPITIGIGIATGSALVGNMGFEQRFDYSCIGDTVNVASRIEGVCKYVGYEILVTETVADQAPELAFLDGGSVVLKGMTGRDRVLLLVGDETMRHSPHFTALQEAHAAFLEGLASGSDDTTALDLCLELLQDVDERLVTFYAACADRLDDFKPAISAAEV